MPLTPFFNLETVVGRKKDAQGIGAHSEIKKFVVTLWVMRVLSQIPNRDQKVSFECLPYAASP